MKRPIAIIFRVAALVVLPLCALTLIAAAQTTYSGHIVDVLQRRVFDGEVVVNDGIISSVKECALTRGKDYPYIMPGFIDGHVHIESSMITPQEYGKAAVCHGTIGVVSDPHEMGNVLGIDGVRYMIRQSKRVPFNILFGAPSCVPCCGADIETSGARIDSKGVAELLAMDDIGFLTEMMDYVGVLNNDPEVMAKIEAAHRVGKPVDGHAPELLGEVLRKYAAAGITTDHESDDVDEGRECIDVGMRLHIREGSAAKNYAALSPLIDEFPAEVMFCTDDYNPGDLMQGHINLIVKRALSDGYDFWNVMQAACVNPQRHYGVNWGLLRQGDPASFILTDAITADFRVLKTVLKGIVVFDTNNKSGSLLPITGEPEPHPNNFVALPITAADIQLAHQAGEPFHIITATDGSLTTGHEVRTSITDDVQKIVVYNRYRRGAKPMVGLVSGFNLKGGAMASSVAHDCHNIVAIGSDDESIVRAINRVVEMKGGQVAVAGNELTELALPIAGLLSPLPVEQVTRLNEALFATVRKAGCKMASPFITMSFMCLPVIPELKITDKYLWDVTTMKPVAQE